MKKKMKFLSLFLALMFMLTLIPTTAFAEGGGTETNDEITLTKEVSDKQSDGSYNLSMSLKGKQVETPAPVDLTIVVDISNSMDNNGKMGITKGAITALLDEVMKKNVEQTNVRVSFVAYGTYGWSYDFTKGKYSKTVSNSYTTSRKEANTALENLTEIDKDHYENLENKYYGDTQNYSKWESRGTNTDAGLLKAKDVTATRNRAEAQSVVVFMTDGLPTYYLDSSNTVQGEGNSTTKDSFDHAVDQAVALKNQGNTIYTIGLLPGASEKDSGIAEHLLSADAVNKVDGTETVNGHFDGNGKWVSKYTTFTYSATTPGYSTHYYPITSSQGVADNMKAIYKEIGTKVKNYASGVVTETIPAEFEIKNEAELIVDGWRIVHNEDGTTTLTKTGVPAGNDEVNLTDPTINIMPKEGYYGCAFTNDNTAGENGANYSYTKYDGNTGTQEFPRPYVFLNPTVADDTYAVNVDDLDNAVIDLTEADGRNITANDSAYNDSFKCEDNEYKLTTRTISLQNAPAGVSVDSTGKVTVDTSNKALKDADKVEFDYTVTTTFTNGTDTKDLTSNVAHVIVYLVRNKSFVIDYGKPVTYTQEKNKVFNGAENNTVALTSEAEGTCGNIELKDKDVTYTLNKFMDAVDTFDFTETIDSMPAVSKSVNMIPATAIYYEDNFQGTGITFDGWNTEGKADESYQDNEQNVPYGKDSSYENKYGYSGGTVHWIKGDGKNNKASFTFTGTGFDVISMTDSTTGWVYMEVYSVTKGEDGQPVESVVARKTICSEFNEDNYLEEGQTATNKVERLYQIPVLNWNNGTGELGTYKVYITVLKDNTFYLDGVRIYNPLGQVTSENNKTAYEAYVADKELNPHVQEVRDILLKETSLKNINGQTGIVFLEKNPENNNIGDYRDYGPENEVYLKNQQGIAFTLKCDGGLPTSIQLGLKAPAGAAATAGVYYLNDKDELVELAKFAVNSATDMNYELPEPKYITPNGGGYISSDGTVTLVIKNEAAELTDKTTAANILAISNIKLGSQPSLKSVGFLAGAPTLIAAKLAYTVEPSEPEEPEEPEQPEVDEVPVISGADSLIIKAGDSFDAMDGVTASDKEDGDLTSKIVVKGEVDNNVPGEYTVSYSVTDSHGNVTSADRMVTVRSNEKPVISGTEDLTIKVKDNFDALEGVTALDKEDGDLTAKVTVKGTVNTKKAGKYTLTYSVTDSDGNTAEVTRTVTVKKQSWWDIIRGLFGN